MSIPFTSGSVVVSGISVPLNGIPFPSGQFSEGTPGSDLAAFLSSVNATFGFNLTPHQFNIEWIPFGDGPIHGASGQLPPIGNRLELFINDFFLRGNITHTDWTTSNAGTVINTIIEDDRKILRRTKLHTEDLGDTDDIPSGVVSIAAAYREINGLLDVDGSPSDPLVQEYERILSFGATYNQILDAINLLFSQNKCSISSNDLPQVSVLEANIGGEIEAIRWQFNLSPLDEALTRVFQDTGFDWYWGMDAQKIYLINKKLSFDLSEASLIDLVSEFGSLSGLDTTKQTGFGEDVVPDSTRFRLLGGHQQGFLNSELLSPIDGLDTSELDGNIRFRKIWDQITVGFNDADGFYRTYIPHEKELQLALAGIEQWTYYKIYQTRSPNADPPGYGLTKDAGSIAAKDPTFQSRLDPLMPIAGNATGAGQSGIKIISNRRDAEHNWVIAFYNRIKNHASTHYGRSYVASGILHNEASGLFRLVDSSWCNVENQLHGGSLSPSGSVGGLFTQDYEINRLLGPVSPFLTDDARVSAHCILPANTVYGAQGDDVPASFGNWTEDAPPFNPSGDGRHYIPITLTVVGQRVKDVRSDELYGFERFPEGTLWCQLPINAGPKSGLGEDSVLANLATLLTVRDKLSGSGLRDLINPAVVLTAYGKIDTVAIPVEARQRYGQEYPTTWVQGENHYQRDEDVQLDDQFVPWAFFPIGSQTSLDVMTDRAMSRVRGKLVPKSSSRYADFTQVGLPLFGFDSFAIQGIGASGLFGEISHGVSDLNIGFGIDGFTTRYKIQSYFPRFGRDAPLGERTRGFLNGIINPIDFAFLELGRQNPFDPINPLIPGGPIDPPIFFDTEKRAVRVTITEVNNVFTLASTGVPLEERYFSIDEKLYQKPFKQTGSSIKDFSEGAICIDGFLNIDDSAIYHTDEFELPTGNTILRYFTGGRAFGNGLIVEVAEQVGDNYNVTIVDPTAQANGIERAIKDLAVLNGTVSIGDKTTLAVQGDAPVSPGESDGTIFLNGTVSDAAGVTPIEIISVTDRGTTSAVCVAQELNSEGVLDSNGSLFSGVIVVPFRQFAVSGDRGFLATPTVNDASTGSGVATNFAMIVKPAFIRFEA
jgi:hypothetical protein